MKSVPVLLCQDLLSYIEGVFSKLVVRHKGAFDVNNKDNVISLLFSGDKGGGFMKFHFEIIAPGLPCGSVFDVHVFSMYGAGDHSENVAQVLKEFRDIISNLARCKRGISV